MKVQHVPIEWVPRTWPLVEKYIADALEYCKGEYTPEQIQVLLSTGQRLLIVVVDNEVIHGCLVLELFNRPSTRVAHITAIGGKLISSKDTVAQLKDLVASFGATSLEGAARESVSRLWRRYGFEEKYRIVGVKL